MVLRWGFVVLFFALWQPTGLAQAAETTLTPTADTTVVYSAPSQSFGSEAVVSALYQGGTDLTNTPEEVKEGLLKFDLSSLPKGRTIQSAKLVLKGSGASVTGYGDIRLRRILETWDESTTWATRPKYSAESEANLEVDHNVFPSEIDLTALVRGWYTGSYANNGVVMRAFGDGDYRTGFYSSDDAHISSKEGGNPAQLIIRYSESGTVSSTSSPRPSTTSTPTSLSAGTSTPTPVTTATVTATAVSTPASTATPLSEFFRKLSPCMPEISRLEISLGGDSATVHAILTRSLPLNVYFYTSSKAGPNKLATDYESSQVIKSAASASHSLVLPGLNPGTTYYFTSVVNGKQDCEQSFALLTLTEKGAGPSLLSGSSHGLSAETKSSNPGPGIASLTILAAPFRVVGHLIFGDAGASPLIWGPFLLAILFWGTLTRGALHRLSLLIKWWRNLPNLRYALTHPVKKGSTWGRVMSSLTMQGISRARIWLLNGKTGAIVAQTSSDEHGFFGFSAPAGSYKVKVTHGAYAFPSAIMPFGYRGDLVRVEGANKVVQLDLPMDPAELTDRSFQRMKGWLERFALLRLPLLLILTVFLGLSFLERTTTLQFLAVLLVAYLWWEEWKNIHDAKILARLVDAQNKAVPFALVHFKNSYGRVYSRSVTDNHGEFRAIVPAGVYSLHIITFHQNDTATNKTIADVQVKRGLSWQRRSFSIE